MRKLNGLFRKTLQHTPLKWQKGNIDSWCCAPWICFLWENCSSSMQSIICPQSKAMIVIDSHYALALWGWSLRDYGLLVPCCLFANFSAAAVYFVATVIIKNLLNNRQGEEDQYEKGIYCRSSRKLHPWYLFSFTEECRRELKVIQYIMEIYRTIKKCNYRKLFPWNWEKNR